MAARLSASVITNQRQSCALLAVGACIASCTHSRITSRLTGRVRSRRLRTDRVVLSSSSTEAMSIWAFPPLKSKVDCAGLIDTEHRQRPPQAEKYRDAQREIEDFLVGEHVPQPFEERVVHRRMVKCEALGVLDGKTLAGRVVGVAGIGRDVVVERRREGGIPYRLCP